MSDTTPDRMDAPSSKRTGAAATLPERSGPLGTFLPAMRRWAVGTEMAGLLAFFAVVITVFSLSSDRFLTGATFSSIAFQLPELGLLTLAMLVPILSGGLNLAVTFTANIAALALAWTFMAFGGPDAAAATLIPAMLAALIVGLAAGWLTGAVIAYTGAHPILVTLSMMIFLRGLGEYLTRGGDITGFPPIMRFLGHGEVLGVPVPLIIFLIAILIWHITLTRTRNGFATYMVGSNIEATRYGGIDTRRVLIWIYAMSGLMCALAGIVMAARFNSVRVGHGESYLLITVLACFLGGVDPFGGFGRVVPVFLALVILQTMSSGLNLIGANQHLATAVWGLFLIGVMVVRFGWRGMMRSGP